MATADARHLAGEVEVVRSTLVGDFLPLVVDLEMSHGSYLFDKLGEREVLDMGMYFASAPLGHNHARVMDSSVSDDLLLAARAKPSNPDFVSEQMIGLVQLFRKEMMPRGMRHLFFIDSGGLAVENALKVAFDWKSKMLGRPSSDDRMLEVMHLERAFHGRTGYTMSLTNTDPNKVARFPKFPWPRIPAPALDEDGGEEDIGHPLTAEEEHALEKVSDVLRERADRIACFVYEPVQGEGGERHLGKAFLQEIEKMCNEHDVLVVADEVQTGGGVSGQLWAHETLGLRPDLIAFGKKLQVCGVIGGRKVDEVANNAFKEESRISSTWGGSIVDAVRCTHLYRHIFDAGLIPRVSSMQGVLSDGLQRLAAGSGGAVSAPRSLGLMGAVSLSDPALRNAVAARALAQYDCLLLPCGGRSIRWRPSLAVTPEDLERSFLAFESALLDEGGIPQ